jgi:predicted component of type VI protein secretion system
VAVRELTAKRTELAMPERLKLGVQRHALGRSTALGRTVQAPAAGATVVVRPVTAEAHLRLLPGGDLHALVVGVFALFDREQTDLDLELHVEGGTRPSLGRTTRLARTAWLASGRPAQVVRVPTRTNSSAPRNAAA